MHWGLVIGIILAVGRVIFGAVLEAFVPEEEDRKRIIVKINIVTAVLILCVVGYIVVKIREAAGA